MKLDHLLSRADDETLQKLLGGPALRLIMLLDPTLATPSKLHELVIELHTRTGLLLSKESRNLLFDLLPLQQANILATIFNVSNEYDVYRVLKNISFRSTKQREALFNFFELTLPQETEHTQTLPIEINACQYPLFQHQRVAARKINHLLQQHPRRVLLHMPTGSGKTRTAMNVVAEHLRKNEPTIAVWLAYSEELCEQAVNEFQKAWSHLGNRKINLYRFWGSHDINLANLNDGFMVAGLAKTYAATKNSIQFINQLGNKTSLVIIDEAHSAIAETYKLILDTLVEHRPQTSLLGLTATPGRTWADIHIDEELSKFFAKRKVVLEVENYDNPVEYLIDQKYLARVDYKPLLYKGGTTISRADLARIEDQLDIPEYILKNLAENEQRNLAIITQIERLTRHHQRILVFAATVSHSELIASILRARDFIADSVTGNTPIFDRERIIGTFKEATDEVRIICNYGVLTTGFDAPRTSAAVIARPTKSLVLYSQMVGRVIRGPKAGGNEAAEVVTVVDYNLPGFGSVVDAFNNWEDVWE